MNEYENEQHARIAEFLMAKFTAICDHCRRQESFTAESDYEAAGAFYGCGWRADSGTLLCPKRHPRKGAKE